MAHRETPHQPNIQDMSIEEKWDRLHDFFWEETGCVWTFKVQ